MLNRMDYMRDARMLIAPRMDYMRGAILLNARWADQADARNITDYALWPYRNCKTF